MMLFLEFKLKTNGKLLLVNVSQIVAVEEIDESTCYLALTTNVSVRIDKSYYDTLEYLGKYV